MGLCFVWWLWLILGLYEVFEFVFEVWYVVVVIEVCIVVVGLGWVWVGVNVEDEFVVFFVLGWMGLVFSVVSYDDSDEVIIWMVFGFYCGCFLEFVVGWLLIGFEILKVWIYRNWLRRVS